MLKSVPMFVAIPVVAVLMTAPSAPASAEGLGLDESNPKEMLEGATRMMLKALELMIKTMPQYDAPVMLENGDILIRRKRGEDDQATPGRESGPDQDRI